MVYVILLNWNGWRDTLECLESVFRMRGEPFRVVVCDNGSTDGSVERIKAWADGNLDVYVPEAKTLRRLTFPPLAKPIRYAEHEAGKGPQADNDVQAPLVIIENGTDLGFAAGNNPGIRYALAQSDMEFVWLLNNDTVVEPHALEALVKRARIQPATGLCGSTIRYYFAPDRVQVLGGVKWHNWIGRCHLLGQGTLNDAPIDAAAIESGMDYVHGASMLVSRTFLEHVGVLNEQYFLYCEEYDWALRAHHRYRLGYAPGSIIYHRDGGTTQHGLSPFSQFHATRSGLLLMRTYHPRQFPVFCMVVILRIFKRIATGDWGGARAVARAFFSTPLLRKPAGYRETGAVDDCVPLAGDSPSS